MKKLSTMSRPELVRELIGSSLASISDATSTYAGPQHTPNSTKRDALLDRKLAVARELLLRDLAERMKTEPVLTSPGAVRDWIRLYCAHLEHEVFILLHLDSRNCLIEAEELFRGTLSQTSVFPREVVKSVLAHNAAGVLLVHNHPSGQPEASRADELLTQSIKQVLSLVDVKVLDHFIVAGTNTLSFAESGRL